MADLHTMFYDRCRLQNLSMGLWIAPSSFTTVYLMFRVIMGITQYLLMIGMFIFIFTVWGDMDATAEASYLFLTQAGLCLKVTIFIIRKSELTEICSFLKLEAFQPRSKEERRILEFHASRMKRISLTFLLTASLTCTLWGLMPLFDERAVLPFRLWIPYDVTTSPNYELTYFFEVAGIYISAIMYNGVDSFALISFMSACAQIDVLKTRLLKFCAYDLSFSQSFFIAACTYTYGTRHLIPNCTNWNGVEEEQSNDVASISLKECIKHHQFIIRLIKKIEKAYGVNIFVQTCAGVGIICVNLLRLFSVDPQSVQFSSMVCYSCAMLFQLYINCWCGQQFTNTSTDLYEVLMQTGWYTQSKEYKSLLYILLQHTRRPITIRVGKIITLSFTTFVSILRMSYSYFAVLNQV